MRRFITLLHAEGATFEIRIPKHGKYKFTASGYFDDVDAAIAAVERWDSLASVYITLNPIEPSLLARAVNRIAERAEATTSDADILWRTNGADDRGGGRVCMYPACERAFRGVRTELERNGY